MFFFRRYILRLKHVIFHVHNCTLFIDNEGIYKNKFNLTCFASDSLNDHTGHSELDLLAFYQRESNTMTIRAKFGKLGHEIGEVDSPHGFCTGLNDEIIVADTNNHRIQVKMF